MSGSKIGMPTRSLSRFLTHETPHISTAPYNLLLCKITEGEPFAHFGGITDTYKNSA